jgi:hypothetical protein
MDDRIGATRPVKLVGANKPVGAKCGAVGLAAQFAVAVIGLERFCRDLPCDTATQTTRSIFQTGTSDFVTRSILLFGNSSEYAAKVKFVQLSLFPPPLSRQL